MVTFVPLFPEEVSDSFVERLEMNTQGQAEKSAGALGRGLAEQRLCQPSWKGPGGDQAQGPQSLPHSSHTSLEEGGQSPVPRPRFLAGMQPGLWCYLFLKLSLLLECR